MRNVRQVHELTRNQLLSTNFLDFIFSNKTIRRTQTVCVILLLVTLPPSVNLGWSVKPQEIRFHIQYKKIYYHTRPVLVAGVVVILLARFHI